MADIEEPPPPTFTVTDRIIGFLLAYWAIITALICLILFTPILICNEFQPKFNCLYVICVMAVFWITEAIPLPITSMMPIFMFPLLGILDSLETCKMYFTDANVMCMGAMMMAIALEYCNLHYRIAYSIMLKVDCSHYKLHAVFAVVTTFISMWITNTAATALLCPVVMAILSELESQGLSKVYEDRIAIGPGYNVTSNEFNDDPMPSRLTVSYFLVIAYCSTIGGTATLIGTGTNIAMKGIYEAAYPDGDLTFIFWFLLFFPPMVIIVILVELGLQFQYLGLWRKNSKDAQDILLNQEAKNAVKQVIRKKYEDLGPMSWHEWMVAIFFMLMVLLLIFRNPGFMPGYALLFNRRLRPLEQNAYLRDSVPVILLFVIMFCIPKTLEFCNYFKKSPKYLPLRAGPGLITWRFMSGKMPWGFLFLLGSGFAIARGGEVTGLNAYLGNKLNILAGLPLILLLLILLIVIKFLTEIMSNVAIVSLTLPVLSTMCQNLKINPFYLMLPATVASSYCFLLPVGTPPNVIIREYAYVRTKQIFIGGLWTSFVTLMVTWLMFIGYGVLIYPSLLTFPEWADLRGRENLRAFILFVENLVNQSRRSGALRGEGFDIYDVVHNDSDFGLYALNWGGHSSGNKTE